MGVPGHGFEFSWALVSDAEANSLPSTLFWLNKEEGARGRIRAFHLNMFVFHYLQGSHCSGTSGYKVLVSLQQHPSWMSSFPLLKWMPQFRSGPPPLFATKLTPVILNPCLNCVQKSSILVHHCFCVQPSHRIGSHILIIFSREGKERILQVQLARCVLTYIKESKFSAIFSDSKVS